MSQSPRLIQSCIIALSLSAIFLLSCRDNTGANASVGEAAGQGSCEDGKKNRGESDVDCGGPCLKKCAAKQACDGDVDCESNRCLKKTCEPVDVVTPPAPRQDVACECIPSANDTDGDCISNAVESANGLSSPTQKDTDADGISDGCEDRNKNGVYDPGQGESNPNALDSDNDGLPDTLEDANKNGFWDAQLGETNAAAADTDADGFADGVEDRNHDGLWNCPENPGGAPCETNPRLLDTDGDGISDSVELRSVSDATFYLPGGATPDANCSNAGNNTGRFLGADGLFGNQPGPDALQNTADDVLADDQTCPWKIDSDDDSLNDGLEDRDANGRVSSFETNPRFADSDNDGLLDGVEDANHDGIFDPATETDPTRQDTDSDGVSDGLEDSGGCEQSTCPSVSPIATCDCAAQRNGKLDANETDPRVPDTDGDGLRDAVEDTNGDGLCQRNAPRDPPSPTDETCGYDEDSDDDSLKDGFEDGNRDGLLDPGETDPRRADPDNDCLPDNFERQVGTDPFRADTDNDGLADGLEVAPAGEPRRRYDSVQRECVEIVCAQTYFKQLCPDPKNVDSDGDGVADGFELLGGSAIGEDRNGNGCLDPGETNPCTIPDGPNDPFPPADVPQPPTIGGTDTTCTLPNGSCSSSQVNELATCSCTAGSPSCGLNGACSSPTVCADGSECQQSRLRGQALVCARGNLRPLNVLKSAENDYSLALPAYRDARKEVQPLFDNSQITFGGRAIGHVFQSKDNISASLPEPVRSVAGAIVRFGNIKIGGGSVCDTVIDDPPIIDDLLQPLITSGACIPAANYVVPNSAQLPSDVAERASQRIVTILTRNGYDVARTAGGNFLAHDDQSGTGLPTAIGVQGATDRYVVRRQAVIGGSVDAVEVSRLVAEALLGDNPYANGLALPSPAHQRGPVADLRIQFFRRELYGRQLNAMQAYETFPVAQYGAVFAVAPLTADCAGLSGDDRTECRLSVDASRAPVDDLTNGSALARASAVIGSGCEPFDPQKSKADFLLVVDDSGSMQDNILAITRAVKDVSLKLRANVANLDWRIALTSSTMGLDPSTFPLTHQLSALPDTYEPFHPTYPRATDAALNGPTGVTGANAFFLYQHSAFGLNGPEKCKYGDSYSDTDPTVSPYCCDIDQADPLEFARQCCSLPQGNAVPSQYTGLLTLSDLNNTTLNAVSDYEGNDTLRCFDFPRFGQNSLPAAFITPYSPSPEEKKRHFNDYACGSPSNNQFVKTWGSRGHLWPPGFVGADTNPRRDGANLLIRNADMLVMQMNRPCGFGNFTPRSGQGSGFEQPLQAAKRAVERALEGGRINTQVTPNDPNLRYRLRKDTPLFSIVLSDEEDYAAKYRNNSAPSAAERDLNSLPQARCVNNGDAGCTIDYCQNTCFGSLVDLQSGQFPYRIPSARDYTSSTATPSTSTNAAYCTTPFTGASTTNITGARRYDGHALVEAGVNENGATAADLIAEPNSTVRDVLNPTNGADLSCDPACGGDCAPCMRFIREKPYIDFFSGACAVPGGTGATANDGRRYEAPSISLPGGGSIVLPLGGFYAITRRAGFQGSTAGSCGSLYPGGDGSAYRDVALASGGRVADICLAGTTTGFTDFLDDIIVEAQGIGSPYRLSGNPISATIRVGVLDKTGKLRMLSRSSVSGWDYNATSRSIAFFTRGLSGTTPEALADQANQVTVDKDVKVFVSYQVWDRQCSDECAVGDVCALCACTAGSPQCCTPQPSFECKPAVNTCDCGACERCDAITNTCKPTDPCGGCSASQVCNSLSLTCQDACPAGSTAVNIPCEGGSCGKVCVTQSGIPNSNGNSCSVGGTSNCCGLETSCAGFGNDYVCVLEPCGGESCIGGAACKPLDANDNPPADFCSPACPQGSVCAPKPCAAEACPAIFQCRTDAAPNQCIAPPQCGCVGACPDCSLGTICVNGTCQTPCPPDVSIVECCSRANVQCCQSGEVFDAASIRCIPRQGCDPACPADQFCDQASGRCLPRGG